jgi:hypothetical protein
METIYYLDVKMCICETSIPGEYEVYVGEKKYLIETEQENWLLDVAKIAYSRHMEDNNKKVLRSHNGAVFYCPECKPGYR